MEGFYIIICLIAACPSAAPQGAAEGQVGRRLHGASRAVQTAAHLRAVCAQRQAFLYKNGFGRKRMAAYMPRDCDAAVIRLRSLSGSRRRSERAGICGKRECASPVRRQLHREFKNFLTAPT